MSQESQVAVSSMHYFASVQTTRLSQFRALRRNVVAAYFEDCSFATQISSIIGRRNFLHLARQKRKIIIRPENRREIFAGLPLGNTQMHHKCHASGGITNRRADAHLAALLFLPRPNVQLYLRQRVQTGEIPKLRLRRIPAES